MSTRAAIVRLHDGAPESIAAVACVLVIGNFDGVHQGHRSVLLEAVAEARAKPMASCVLTFDPHPAAVVGTGAPPMLTTLARRAELVGDLGVERVYVRTFDAAFAACPAEVFVEKLVSGALLARSVVVGQNFRYGAKRAGDLAQLRALGARLGFDVRVHEIARDGRGPFSSSRARDAIGAGDLQEATRVLGRPHCISGIVVRGDRRGQTIQFPTANLDRIPEMLPANGVYAVQVERYEESDATYRPLGGGVTNIGVRPTIASATGMRTVETFVLGFAGDLYGRELRLHFVSRLRDEKKFSSLDELKEQIVRDVARARERLGE